jgi:FtsP/CotA-like multicopper oxidase with cupredoxin domain
MNRNRVVLPVALAASALLIVPVVSAQLPLPAAQVPLAGNKIPQFVDPLPVLGKGIPVVTGTDVKLSVCEFQANVLSTGTFAPRIAPTTWVWGYREGGCPAATNPLVTDSYIGPVIVATRGTPTTVTYKNELGNTLNTKVLAYRSGTDQTLMWADPLGTTPTNVTNDYPTTGFVEGNFCAEYVKMHPGLPPPGFCGLNYDGPIAVAPHLHGGEIPAMLDGGPDAWWTADGKKGHGFYTKTTLDPKKDEAIYTYPNGQEAAPIWFHDHTLGATRLNVYAGIAGAYMIVDPSAPLPTGMTPLGLDNGTNALDPSMKELLIPIVLQDRMFDVTGQLLLPNVGLNLEHPFWVPEFVGDTIVVNGKAWPFHTVEPKRYRFLFLNGSNARAYELFLINKATGAKGPAMWVIGTDQGYLDTPVKIDPNLKPNDKLIIMPGERYEVIIDFGNLPAGTRLLLSNTAKTPYPAGGPVNGRTTGRIMEFRVGGCTSGRCTVNGVTADASYNPAVGTAIRADTITIVRLANPATGQPAPEVDASGNPTGTPITVHKVRRLTLNEVIGPGGPLEILVNNTTYTGNTRPDFGGCSTEPTDPACGDFTKITTQWNNTYYSELPHEGETEMWEIVNLTADAHPIHPHLVAFQLMNRQAFDFKGYDAAYNGSFSGGLYLPGYGPPLDYNCGAVAPDRGVFDPLTGCAFGGNPDVTPFLVGAPALPLPSEAGWKDTVISYPGQVTRMLVRFAPTPLPNNTDADTSQAAYHFSPNGGHGYVWHCHIIDHEDNEMMRPFSVFANPNPAITRSFVMGVDF